MTVRGVCPGELVRKIRKSDETLRACLEVLHLDLAVAQLVADDDRKVSVLLGRGLELLAQLAPAQFRASGDARLAKLRRDPEAVHGGVRVVAGVVVTGAPGEDQVDGVGLGDTFELLAIGAPDKLTGSLTRSGGVIAQLAATQEAVVVTVTPPPPSESTPPPTEPPPPPPSESAPPLVEVSPPVVESPPAVE